MLVAVGFVAPDGGKDTARKTTQGVVTKTANGYVKTAPDGNNIQ
jgi:hypothetical protein